MLDPISTKGFAISFQVRRVGFHNPGMTECTEQASHHLDRVCVLQHLRQGENFQGSYFASTHSGSCLCKCRRPRRSIWEAGDEVVHRDVLAHSELDAPAVELRIQVAPNEPCQHVWCLWVRADASRVDLTQLTRQVRSNRNIPR